MEVWGGGGGEVIDVLSRGYLLGHWSDRRGVWLWTLANTALWGPASRQAQCQ